MTCACDLPGCSKSATNKAADERQPEAYPLRDVEDCRETRTTVAIIGGERSLKNQHRD